jgi:multisubunit Na+/H+ antiporter MnhB subunit
MPQYAWKCHVCGSANNESHERCGSCDCPAFASGKEILARKEALESGLQVSGPSTKHSASVVSVFLLVVSVALFYMFGWYIAGRGAESNVGFIAFVVSFLLALLSGIAVLFLVSIHLWKTIRTSLHKGREK